MYMDWTSLVYHLVKKALKLYGILWDIIYNASPVIYETLRLTVIAVEESGVFVFRKMNRNTVLLKHQFYNNRHFHYSYEYWAESSKEVSSEVIDEVC